MSIIIRRPWTRQPQSHARVDWSNPLTQGLVVAAVGGIDINLADGKPITKVGTVTPSVGTKGRAWFTNDGAGNRQEITPRVNATEFSALAIFRSDGTSATLQYVIAQATNAGAINALSLQSATSVQLYWGVGAAGVASATIPSATGRWVTASGSSRLTSLQYTGNLVVDGVNYPGSDISTADVAASTAPITLSGRTYDNARNLGGDIALALWWDRRLSVQEHLSLHANPWQLFAPQTQRIWTPAAASTYALGTPTYVPGSITSTGFRPRIPVTVA